MNGLQQLLADDTTVKAIANVFALLTGTALIGGAIYRLWLFCQSVYRTSFKTAVKKRIRRGRRSVIWGAWEIHSFIGRLVIQGAKIAFYSIIYALMYRAISVALDYKGEYAGVYLAFTLATTAMVIVILSYVISWTFFYIIAVVPFRVRMRRRAILVRRARERSAES